jgi:integrase
MSSWNVSRQKVLTMAEIKAVLADLHRKARRSVNTRQNLILFRLATCCGLRASELCGLTLDNVRTDTSRPHIRVPKAIAKGRKARVVPLSFDAGTLADLREWKQYRASQGATGSDSFLCSQSKRSFGKPIDRRNARKRYKAACRCLGAARVAEITIHHGRHSFVSHALHGGRSPVEVQQAAGHASLAVTTIYAHLVDEDEQVGNLFG